MKIASWIGCGVGVLAFVFATYTAVSGPNLRLESSKPDKERIARIGQSARQEGGGGCCAKNEAGKAGSASKCEHSESQAGCAAQKKESCPHH